VGQENKLDEWYQTDANDRPEFIVPNWMKPSGYRVPGFRAFSSQKKPVQGTIQGRELVQYDFTDAQYEALIHLTAALCRVFPEINCDYPKDKQGNLIEQKLEDEKLETYGGILGHYHIQSNKIDPGPAFDWDRLIHGAQSLMR